VRPGRRLLLVALGAAVGALAYASRQRLRVGDPQGNGGATRTSELRHRISEARERLRRDPERAREE
jgi:hypothetical protein